MHIENIPPEYLKFSKSIFSSLREVLLSKFLWTVMVFSILILFVFPPAINLIRQGWWEKGVNNNRDPFVAYVSDGASLALGGKIFLTNHPGTPIHEYFAWATGLIRRALFQGSNLPVEETKSATRQWIQLNPQTFFFLLRFSSILAIMGLLLSVMLFSKSIFGDQWLGLFAALTIASSGYIARFAEWNMTETYALFAFTIAYCSALKFLCSRPSLSNYVMALFWIALLMSFKIYHLPFVAVFLLYVFLFVDDKEGVIPEKFKKPISHLTFLGMPAFMACFCLMIMVFKYHKLNNHAVHVLLVLVFIMLCFVAGYLVIHSYRKTLINRPFFGLGCLFLLMFFVLINVRMSWGSFMYFLLMGGESLQFQPNLFKANWAHMGEQMRSWIFWIGVGAWALFFLFKSRLKTSFNRAIVYLMGPMMVPLYFLLFNSRVRIEYYANIDILSVLFFFSCVGLFFHWRSEKKTTVFQKILLVGVGISLIIPIAKGSIILTPSVLFNRVGGTIISMESFFPLFFDQGRDSKHFYSGQSKPHLNFANMYSDFRFPVDSTADERIKMKEQFLTKYPHHKIGQ